MTHFGPIAIGAGLSALLLHERNARRAAERMAAAALETLLNAIDANDSQTGAHVRRVAHYALIIGDAAGWDEGTLRSIERVALFHDIGKIHEALFDIIHEGAELSEDERRAIATHPRRGADVLAPLKSFYPELPEGVLAHHEHWDGSGYPKGLRGLAIPLTSRVVAIADTFDAITHRRRYRDGRGADDAAAAISRARGTQFDPELVDLVLAPPVWEQILEAHRTSHRRRLRPAGKVDAKVPDVTFRWRSKTIDSAGAAHEDGVGPAEAR